jgi:integrase
MGRLAEGAVVKVKLNYVDAQRDRDGRIKYWYFRRAGVRQKLPGDPGSEEFAATYQALLSAKPKTCTDPALDRRSYVPGTFGALVNDYLASAAFKEKAESTQALYRRVLDKLCAENCTKPVRLMKRRHIRKMRDVVSETPGTANNVLRLLKIVLNFAVEEEMIEVSPAARVKELKGGEYRSWTDEECAQFERRWASGTMERRAFTLALYTGQRRADLVAMTRAHRKNGVIQVRQSKTGEELWITEHSALTAELALGDQNHMSLLTTSRGKAFDPVYFGAWFADAIYEVGLPDDCVLHGLRKCAARKFAEAGCSEQEIMSVTGHRTGRGASSHASRLSRVARIGASFNEA